MRLTDERGATLVEVLVTLVIGLVIVFASANALDGYARATRTVEDRTDNVQSSRLAMDLVMRSLRSQACPASGASSVLAGDATSLAYVTDLGDGSTAPEKRVLRFDTATSRLTEERFSGSWTDTSRQTVTFNGSSSGVKPLLDKVTQSVDAAPVFSYFAYDASSPPSPVLQLPVPLSATDLRRVARIRVVVRRGPPAGARNAATAFTVDDSVLLRSVDPYDSTPVPQCP